MKRTILALMCCLFVILTGCNKNHADSQPLNENVFYNQCDDYVKSGARLVDRVFVSEKEFCANYDVDVKNLSATTNFKVEFALEYVLDLKTVQADLSKLSNGVITVSENENVVFVMYISSDKSIAMYGVNCDTVIKSSFGTIEAELYDLSKDKKSLLYGSFNLGDYYITCSMYNKSEADFTKMIKDFISANIK